MRSLRPLLTLACGLLPLAAPALAGLWTPIGPDGGASIRRLLVDPVTPTTVYASTNSSVYKSLDGGLTWAAAGAGLPVGGLPYRIALVPSAPATLYAGILVGVSTDRLYKSVDAGGSWTLLPPSGAPAIRSLAVDPTTPGRLYFGSYNGSVYRSTDGGTTWAFSVVPGAGLGIEALAADPVVPGVVYAATLQSGGAGDGLFKSTDGGVSFVQTTLMDKDVTSIAVDPVTPSTVYAATDSFAYPRSAPFWKSTDGGATWTATGAGLPSILQFEAPIAIDPTVPSIVYVGGFDGPYRSVDGGATFTLMASGLPVPRTEALAVHPTASGTLWAGTEGGVGRSVDGAASWTMHGTGIREDDLTGFAVDPADPAVLYAASVVQGIQKSVDAGAHWSPANAGLPAVTVGALVMSPGSSTMLHGLVSDGQFVVRTQDGAATWSVTTAGLPALAVALALAVDPSDPAIVYAGIDAEDIGGGTSGVFRSTDGGATWSPTSGPLDISIRALAVASSGRVYAGTDFPRFVYGSDDGGASWSPGAFVPTGVLTLAVDPADPLTVFAGTAASGVHRSTDGGATWAPGAFVGTPQVNFVLLDPAVPGAVYAGTADGVQASLDAGAHWTDVSGGMVTREVTALALDPTVPGRLYAATTETAAYRRDLGACATDLDCDDANLCTTDACLPGDSASDAFGCVHTFPPCPPAGDCQTGAGVCNRDTGACSYTNRPDGVACTSDGSGCTVDACSAGVCRHTAQLILSCRTPGVPGASVFTFKNTSPQRAALTWKWKKGDATLGELGDPFTAGGSDYDVCVFDHGGSGGSPRYLFAVSAPAGGTCAGKPCWSSSATTVRYRDKDRTPNGLATLVLKPGAPGAASFSATAKGVNLTLPTAALAPGVTVQLRRDASTPVCWQGIYATGIKKNVPGAFRAKSE